MKISALATTLLIAATAHAAETKQHVRRTQDGLEKLSEAIEVRYITSCSICYIMMCILYRMLCVSYHSYHLSYLFYSHQWHIYLDLFIVRLTGGILTGISISQHHHQHPQHVLPRTSTLENSPKLHRSVPSSQIL